MKRVLLACVLAACGGRSTPPATPASSAAGSLAIASSDPSHAAASPVATPARSAADGAPDCAHGSSSCAQLAQFAREMCRCTDAACAERIAEAMTRWGAPPARLGEMERLSDPEAGQIAAIVDRLAACMQRATIQSRTPPPS